ncbi:hypothetical protein J6590_084291 [Homalodisca vitripennis]|nr:hypothetical protein J6590_084291 [Homalodisca vitripennis]
MESVLILKLNRHHAPSNFQSASCRAVRVCTSSSPLALPLPKAVPLAMSHCRGVADVAQRTSRRPPSAALCGWSDPWPRRRRSYAGSRKRIKHLPNPLTGAPLLPLRTPSRHHHVLVIYKKKLYLKKLKKILFLISYFMHYTYRGEFPGKVVAHPFIDSELSHTFNLTGQGKPVLQLPDKTTYLEGKVPLKKAKLNDIIKLRPYTPIELEEWYSEIYIWPTTEEEHEDFDD